MYTNNWGIIKREIEFDRETKNVGKIQLVHYLQSQN